VRLLSQLQQFEMGLTRKLDFQLKELNELLNEPCEECLKGREIYKGEIRKAREIED